MNHFYEALTEGRADAALAASLFHYKELTIPDLKSYLAGKGLPIRLTGSDAADLKEERTHGSH